MFWFFKALIKNGVQRFLLTYASRIYKLLYPLRIWNFSLVLKLKPRKWNFATTQTHFLHYFKTHYYCSLLCNNSKTLYAQLLNSLLFVCILQHHKLWPRSMILSNELNVVILHTCRFIYCGGYRNMKPIHCIMNRLQTPDEGFFQ